MKGALTALVAAVIAATLVAGCPFNAGSRGDLFSAGVSFQRDRDFDMAAALFRRIVDRNPDDAAAWRRLAECEAGRGRVDAATTAYRRYVELNPDAVPLVAERLTSMGVDPIVLANRPGADDVTGMTEPPEVTKDGDPGAGDGKDPPPLGGKRVSDEMLGEWAPRGTYYPGGAGAPAGVFGAILPTRLDRTLPGPKLPGPAWAVGTDELGTLVVVGTSDGKVRVFEFGEKKPAATFSVGDSVLAISVEPGGERFAIANATGVVTVHRARGERVGRLDTGGAPVRALALERGGHRLYAAGDGKELLIWHVDDGVVEDRTPLPSAAVAMDLAPEARFLAVGLADGRVVIVDPISSAREKVLKDHDARCTGVAFTGDARTLVTTSWDGTARVYRHGTWEPMATHPLHAHIVTALAAGARVAVTGSADLRVKVWEAETGIELVHLLGHEHEVEAVAVSADGRRVASVDFGGALRFWEIR